MGNHFRNKRLQIMSVSILSQFAVQKYDQQLDIGSWIDDLFPIRQRKRGELKTEN